jgi:hypothetical protein
MGMAIARTPASARLRHRNLRAMRMAPLYCMAMVIDLLRMMCCLNGVSSSAFVPRSMHCLPIKRDPMMLLHATAKPRTGIAQQLLDIALASPIWTYILVPQARASSVRTAEENNIPWVSAKEWLKNQDDAPWKDPRKADEYGKIQYPEYYKKSFHAYPNGNLSYDAAFEQELAR